MASDPILPKGFVDLATAYTSSDGDFVNIIGVVVDRMEPTTTRTNDYTVMFKLLDQRLANWVTGSEGLTVRYFKKDPTQLPKVQNCGDVVLLRSVKITTITGQRIALVNLQTETTVFPSNRIPDPGFAISVQGTSRILALGIERDISKFNMLEQDYVIRLKKAMADFIEASVRKHQERVQRLEQRPDYEPPAKKRKSDAVAGAKFRLIKDLEPQKFYDLCGEVVKCIKTQYGECDLYITDYTANDLLRLYDPPENQSSEGREGDNYGYADGFSKKSWPGPYGQLTLKLNLKHPHAQFAIRNLSEGDFVLLQNVKTRATSAGPWLEGDMWPDDLDPTRIKVRKLEGHGFPEVNAVRQRKDAYWNSRADKLAEVRKGLNYKPEPELEAGQKPKNKKRKSKQKASGAQGSSAEEERVPKARGKHDSNAHIRCNFEEVQLSSIRHIIDPGNSKHTNSPPDGPVYTLPFINAKYRAKVRVVDFEPKALENFAVPPLDDEASQDSMAWQYDVTPRYEWYFSLLLEDATRGSLHSKENNRIWVQVHHEQAQYLLGNGVDDPGDLRRDSTLLKKLREKMFILWGNLEESGGQGLSNLPFECCIQEYGIEMDEDDPARGKATLGWKRMYSMFGVTIR